MTLAEPVASIANGHLGAATPSRPTRMSRTHSSIARPSSTSSAHSVEATIIMRAWSSGATSRSTRGQREQRRRAPTNGDGARPDPRVCALLPPPPLLWCGPAWRPDDATHDDPVSDDRRAARRLCLVQVQHRRHRCLHPALHRSLGAGALDLRARLLAAHRHHAADDTASADDTAAEARASDPAPPAAAAPAPADPPAAACPAPRPPSADPSPPPPKQPPPPAPRPTKE